MSQEINRPGLNQGLTGTLGMKGARSPAGLLTPEINPVIVLENDRPELHYVSGSMLYACQSGWEQTIPAAQVIGRFIVGAGVIHVVEYMQANLILSAPATTDGCAYAYLNALTTNTLGANAMTAFPCDGRFFTRSLLGTVDAPNPSISPPGAIIDHANWQTGTQGGNVYLLKQRYPIIATEGQEWGISCFVPAETLVVEFTFHFRVRPILDEEKAKR